jgi:signal transduction histidine kinase
MMPLRLTSWFRARMVPLVAATGLLVAASAPCAFYVSERFDQVAAARRAVGRVAEIVRERIEQQPALWRYGSAKLAERLTAEGLADRPIRVIDDEGVEVPLQGTPSAPRHALWGRVEVDQAGRLAATVWAACDHGALVTRTAQLMLIFLVLGAGLAGVLYGLPIRAIGAAERRIAQLLAQLALTLQEADRRRIARDLHDGAGQALTAARLELLAMRATHPVASPEKLERIATRLDEAIDEVRRSTTALAPPALDELGLVGALRRHCEAFGDASGLVVSCELPEELSGLGPELETACYRIVQEALTNAARHAGATRARIALAAKGGRLRLEVSDDGSGLDGETPDHTDGRGLAGIRERAGLLGGEVELESPQGQGLCLRVSFPLPAPGEKEVA